MKQVGTNRLEVSLIPHQPLARNKFLNPASFNPSGATASSGEAEHAETSQRVSAIVMGTSLQMQLTPR